MTLLLNLGPFVILAVIAWLALRSSKEFSRTSRMTDGIQPIENLIALAEYDVDETGCWKRVRWLGGILFGIGFAVVELVSPIPNTRYSPPIVAAISFVIGAPMFGLMTSSLMRWRVRLVTAALYAGKQWIIDPPPTNQLAYHQVLCTWVNGAPGVRGVLYIGRKGLIFQPHKRNGRSFAALEMGPINILKIALIAPIKGNTIQRVLGPRPLKRIEIRWNDARACFLMPNPAENFVKLSRCLETLQSIPK